MTRLEYMAALAFTAIVVVAVNVDEARRGVVGITPADLAAAFVPTWMFCMLDIHLTHTRRKGGESR